MIGEAFVLMVGATLAQHLGLSSAIAEVLSKIASCNICLTFWVCLFCLIVVLGHDPAISAVISILMSYTSNWLGLVMGALQRAYTHLFNKVYENNENNCDHEEADRANTL